MKSTAISCLLLFTALHLQAQTWTIETLRADIQGAWSRTADFDQDNDPDILVQSGDTIYWYENLRPGWAPHLIDPTFYNSTFGYVDVLDIDGDGDKDVLKAPISTTGKDSLTWNENQANSTIWIKHSILKLEGTIGWMQGSYGDLDNDGDLDLVVPEYDFVNIPSNGNLYWLENMDNTGVWTKHLLLPGNHWYGSVADMDGDGDLDIVGAYEGVFWLENKLPNTDWTKHQVVAGTFNGHYLGDCIDINGDGTADIVSGPSETTGGLVYYSNPGWTETSINANQQGFMYLGAIGDIDGDGDPDITYGGSGYSAQALGWAENTNSGADWILHDISPSDSMQRIPTGLADIDGDGDTDIVSLTFDVNTALGSVFWAANPKISSGVSGPAPFGWPALQVAPNPVSDKLYVRTDAASAEPILLELFDLNGKLILRTTAAGNATPTLEMGELPAGLYHLRVLDGSRVGVRKVVKE